MISQTETAPATPKKRSARNNIVRNGTAGSPGKTVAAANRWRETYNPLRGLTITRAVQLLESGQQGNTAELQLTYRMIERRHPVLSGLLSRCEAPLLNFDWEIKRKSKLPPGATDAMADAQEETLRNAYEAIDNLSEAICHLHLKEFRGYSHIQKHRSTDGEVMHLECLHHWCIARDGMDGDWFWNPESRSTTPTRDGIGDLKRIGSDELPREDFIIGTSPRPINEIALINLVRRNLCEKDADGFIEIYGIPGGVVTMPPNVPTGKETEYESAAAKVAEGGSGAIPNGSTYTANDGPRGTDPFTPRFNHLDEDLILVGTGGKLTMLAESGSGTLAGGAHQDTFDEIARGRAAMISELFQKQFDAEVLAREHANEPQLVYFELCIRDRVDAKELVANVTSLKSAGYKADLEWLAEKTGYELEEVEVEAVTEPGDEPRRHEDTKEKLKNRFTAKSAAQALHEDIAPLLSLIEVIADQPALINRLLERQPRIAAAFRNSMALRRYLTPELEKQFTEGTK